MSVFFWYLSLYTGAMPRLVEPYLASLSRASSSASWSRWNGNTMGARSLTSRLSGPMCTPFWRTSSISCQSRSRSTTTPLPSRLTVPRWKMPEGSRCSANLPYSLSTVWPALLPP